jgi:Predicted membrane protein
MSKITAFFRSLVSMRDHVDLEAAAVNIRSNIYFRGPNVFILACAIVIASVGLNLNSIPVIIGAMLISPVMGPILGFGLGLGTNDTVLVKDSLKNFLVMVLISILSSTLFYLLSPLQLEHQTELLARTNPTLYDAFIALFGGFAGILENSRKEKGGTVIPGVAIATALMPPLCTVGYGIANLEWRFIVGAFYLFLINTVFISLATFVTVKYLHFPTPQGKEEALRRRSARWIAVIMVVMLVPSIWSAVQMIQDNNFAINAQRLVHDNTNLGKSYIYDYRTDVEANPPTLELFLAGEKMDSATRERLFLDAEQSGITRSQIIIREDAAFQNEIMTESEIIRNLLDSHDREVAQLQTQVDSLSTSIEFYKAQQLPSVLITREIAAQYAGVEEVILTRGERIQTGDGKSDAAVVAIVRTAAGLKDTERERIEQWLRVRLGVEDVTVIVRK